MYREELAVQTLLLTDRRLVVTELAAVLLLQEKWRSQERGVLSWLLCPLKSMGVLLWLLKEQVQVLSVALCCRTRMCWEGGNICVNINKSALRMLKWPHNSCTLGKLPPICMCGMSPMLLRTNLMLISPALLHPCFTIKAVWYRWVELPGQEPRVSLCSSHKKCHLSSSLKKISPKWRVKAKCLISRQPFLLGKGFTTPC